MNAIGTLSLLASLFVLATTSAPAAAQSIYRCDDGGRVTYTDAPCERPSIRPDGAAPAPATAANTQTVVGGGYVNPYGPWRGQTQFQAQNAGLRSEGTHIVTPLVLDIAEDGKVTGDSAESGCAVLGVASPGITPAMLNLDVTVSNCPAKVFNRRYRGSLHMEPKSRSAQLRLHAQSIGIGQSTFADVTATMRR